MEAPFDSIRGERDCGRQAILSVEKRLNSRNVSAAPHETDLRHPIAFVQLGHCGELPLPVAAEYGLADILIGREEG
jgi:hypothetical protein